MKKWKPPVIPTMNSELRRQIAERHKLRREKAQGRNNKNSGEGTTQTTLDPRSEKQ